MHVQQRVSGDGSGMHEQRPQVRVMHRKQVLEQRRMPRLARVLKCTVRIYISEYHAQPRLFDENLHVLRGNGRHRELLPNAQYRQMRVVHRKQVLAQRRMPSVDHVLEFSVRIYVSDYHAQPCLFDKSLHVLWRNSRHGELLPDAQYPQVRIM